MSGLRSIICIAKLRKEKGGKLMEEAQIILERHEQRLNTLERDISDLKAVQSEIRTMNETLVTLAKATKVELINRY